MDNKQVLLFDFVRNLARNISSDHPTEYDCSSIPDTRYGWFSSRETVSLIPSFYLIVNQQAPLEARA